MRLAIPLPPEQGGAVDQSPRVSNSPAHSKSGQSDGSGSPSALVRASINAFKNSGEFRETIGASQSCRLQRAGTVIPGGSMEQLYGEPDYRYWLRSTVRGRPFEMSVGLIIFVNFVIVVYEADVRASHVNDESGSWGVPVWVEPLHIFFISLYVFEIAVRIFAERWLFFLHSSNLFDLACVVTGVVCELVSFSVEGLQVLSDSATLLRTCRFVRLLQMVRALVGFQELWSLISGLVSAAKTLFWASVLIFTMLTMCSVIAVEAIHPLMGDIADTDMYSECPWCRDAFRSVMESNLTFFGCISGGDWPLVARPLIVAHPWTGLIFITLIMMMFFGMLNLITAVIVDAAGVARANDVQSNSQSRMNQQQSAKRGLETLCRQMDTDGSGTISLEEVLEGFRNVPDFAALLQTMDVAEDDLQCVFSILDTDGTGEVDYKDFTEQLWRMKAQEVKTTLMFVKHYILQLRGKVDEQLVLCRDDIMAQNLTTQLRMDNLSDTVTDTFRELRDRFIDYTDAAAAHLQPGRESLSSAWTSTSIGLDGEGSACSPMTALHTKASLSRGFSSTSNISTGDGIASSIGAKSRARCKQQQRFSAAWAPGLQVPLPSPPDPGKPWANKSSDRSTEVSPKACIAICRPRSQSRSRSRSPPNYPRDSSDNSRTGPTISSSESRSLPQICATVASPTSILSNGIEHDGLARVLLQANGAEKPGLRLQDETSREVVDPLTPSFEESLDCAFKRAGFGLE